MNRAMTPATDAFGWPRIVISLLLATLLALAPWGQSPAVPNVLVLALTFWALHQPTRGLLAAGFLLGLLMDVHLGTTLGEQAMNHTVAVWLTLQFQRRISWFRMGGQMLHVLGILLVAQGCVAGARFLLGLPFLGPEQFLQSLTTMLLWPLAGLLLLAPVTRQRPHHGAAGGNQGPRTSPFVAPDEAPGLEQVLTIFARRDDPDHPAQAAAQALAAAHPAFGTPVPADAQTAAGMQDIAAGSAPTTAASTPESPDPYGRRPAPDGWTPPAAWVPPSARTTTTSSPHPAPVVMPGTADRHATWVRPDATPGPQGRALYDTHAAAPEQASPAMRPIHAGQPVYAAPSPAARQMRPVGGYPLDTPAAPAPQPAPVWDSQAAYDQQFARGRRAHQASAPVHDASRNAPARDLPARDLSLRGAPSHDGTPDGAPHHGTPRDLSSRDAAAFPSRQAPGHYTPRPAFGRVDGRR